MPNHIKCHMLHHLTPPSRHLECYITSVKSKKTQLQAAACQLYPTSVMVIVTTTAFKLSTTLFLRTQAATLSLMVKIQVLEHGQRHIILKNSCRYVVDL